MFTKVITKPLEIELQDIAARYGFAPKIQRVDGEIVPMDSVKGQCLADIYTDDPTLIPDAIWVKIEHMLSALFEREGIEYVASRLTISWKTRMARSGLLISVMHTTHGRRRGRLRRTGSCDPCWLASLERRGIRISPSKLGLMQNSRILVSHEKLTIVIRGWQRS